MPASLSIRVNPSTLFAGTYTSTITITATGVTNPLTIPVALTVTLPGAAATLTPTTLTLAYPGTLTGTFTITAGPVPATFTASAGSAWLGVSPAAGVVLPSETQTLTVTVNGASLAPQSTPYAGKITVAVSSGGVTKTQIVAVNLTVNAQTPTVASVWPAQIPVGSPDTTVTIRGANFYAATAVTASGSTAPLKIGLVSGGIILATIPAPLLAAAGSINLTVTNPAPGGSAAPFGISVGNAPSIGAITNAASYATGAISPGELITIFGQNLGPTNPAPLSIVSGYVQTSAGGTTVTIDGQAAPITYASNVQVTVQVPYTVQLGTAKTVILDSGTGTPAQTMIDIVAAAPGIFTLNASGSGQALVENFNATTLTYSVNSSNNPAKIGSTITFFLTGEGDYAGSVYSPETGMIVPATPPASGAYPQLSPLPAVTIGGVPANVAYAGPIPTGMLGLLQINAVVPAGVATGSAVPLVVTIGTAPGVQAQANLTMAVAP